MKSPKGFLTLLEPKEIRSKSEDVGTGHLGFLRPEIFNNQAQRVLTNRMENYIAKIINCKLLKRIQII